VVNIGLDCNPAGGKKHKASQKFKTFANLKKKLPPKRKINILRPDIGVSDIEQFHHFKTWTWFQGDSTMHANASREGHSGALALAAPGPPLCLPIQT
jgi:hypothetical protein